MISQNQAAETQIALNSIKDSGALRGEVKIKVHDKYGNDVGILDMYEGYEIGSGIENDSFLNKSLDTAKIIFSKLAAGKVEYAIAKIAFGNAGHNFGTPKVAVEATEADVGLKSAKEIQLSMAGAAEGHFVYPTGGNSYRMVYIEKDISAENITYGVDGDQFIVRVPISYDEFNYRTGGATGSEVAYDTDLISYTFIVDDATIMRFAGAETNGDATLDQTEIKAWDDGGTIRYTFKNGLDEDGNIDTLSGGTRPQEISEILLCTNIIGNGTTTDYEKLASSRMTSGLLAFPDGFTFTYEWTLTWNFS